MLKYAGEIYFQYHSDINEKSLIIREDILSYKDIYIVILVTNYNIFKLFQIFNNTNFLYIIYKIYSVFTCI